MAAPAPTTTIHPPPFFNQSAGKQGGMEYVYLGRTGAVVSKVCLGLMSYAKDLGDGFQWTDWLVPEAEAEQLLKQALDAGITFFDTAEVYSNGRSEMLFGEMLKKLLPASRFTRADLFISTKIHPLRSMREEKTIQKSLSRKAIFDAVEGSLKRMGLDYIDLYFIHRFDPHVAPEETMKALHDVVQSGKVRYIGASSMFVWQFNLLQSVAKNNGWTQFSVMQNHYNAVYREEEREMNPYCVHSGVALMPWSPLASGVLARTPDAAPTKRQQTDQNQRSKYYKNGDDAVVAAVQGVAKARGVPPAQVALAWLWRKQGVATPIIGATKAHHISDAVAAVNLNLTDDEMQRIEHEYLPHAISGHA